MARILSVMQAEGDTILTEGIAASPEAIDVVMINGFGFPRWRGGPMFMKGGRRDRRDRLDGRLRQSSYVPGSEALAALVGNGRHMARHDGGSRPGADRHALWHAPAERFDLFVPDGKARGLIVFVHGGYWQWMDKSAFSHLAEGPRRGAGPWRCRATRRPPRSGSRRSSRRSPRPSPRRQARSRAPSASPGIRRAGIW
jgi:hypothetical protein